MLECRRFFFLSYSEVLWESTKQGRQQLFNRKTMQNKESHPYGRGEKMRLIPHSYLHVNIFGFSRQSPNIEERGNYHLSVVP